MTVLTHDHLERELGERRETLDALRENIDRLPHGNERESLIDSLMDAHAGIEELLREQEETR